MSKKRYKALGQNSLAFEACAAVLSRGTQALPHGARLWQARGLLELQQVSWPCWGGGGIASPN